MRPGLFCILSVGLFAALGCSPAQRSPDAIRQDTAKATSAAARDAKAVVQGVVEGLKTKGPLNINKATADQLETLPGIGADDAHRIIAARPFDDSRDLVKRHILTKSQYNHIAEKVTAR